MQNTWGFSPLEGGLAFLPATGLIVLLTPVTGIVAQRVGTRLDLLLLGGLLLSGLSFLYVALTLNPQSTYSDGLLPAFLMRGLAIPVITSCATLAVMGAVPSRLSGLASGTLGMARNIGTAFGVAVLSQIYLFHVNSALSASLAANRAAADQFRIPNKGGSGLLVERSIFQGFGLTALTCTLLCGGAVILIFFMRAQARKKVTTLPAQEEEEQMLLIAEAAPNTHSA